METKNYTIQYELLKAYIKTAIEDTTRHTVLKADALNTLEHILTAIKQMKEQHQIEVLDEGVDALNAVSIKDYFNNK